jgi:hypothetical protein
MEGGRRLITVSDGRGAATILASPPEAGELRTELARLASRAWQHPVSGPPACQSSGRLISPQRDVNFPLLLVSEGQHRSAVARMVGESMTRAYAAGDRELLSIGRGAALEGNG